VKFPIPENVFFCRPIEMVNTQMKIEEIKIVIMKEFVVVAKSTEIKTEAI